MKTLSLLTLTTALLGATAASAGGLSQPAALPAAPVVPVSAAPVAVVTAPAFSFGDARFGVNVGVSTLGFTVEPTVRFGERFGLRAPIGTGSFEREEESDGETYSGDLDIGGVGLLADYFPTGDGFHISAGIIRTNYAVDLLGTGVEVGDEVTDVEVSVSQRRDLSPILAVGYEAPVFGRVVLSASAGAIFGDGFDVTARSTNPNSGVTQAEIDAEIADIRETANDLDIVPYFKLALGYRF